MRRKKRTSEEANNIKKARNYILLTIALLVLFVYFGFPTIAKLSTFIVNFKKDSEPVTISDSTPPAPPKLNDLPEATNKTEVEISGKAENGATVIIYANRKEVELLADKSGEFIYNFKLNKGENTIYAKAIDATGNESVDTDTIIIIQDSDDPTLTVTKPNDGENFVGASQRQVTIEGTTEEGVTLNINDRLVVVDSFGGFTFFTTLSEGENTFNFKVVDKAGNETETSITLNFGI